MDIDRINLNLFRVLDVMLAERNVTRAAARLHLTQSATSSALARLRVVVNDPLFIRTPRGMQPTPKARSLAEPVRRALEELSHAIGTSSLFDPSTSTQTFRLATTDHALSVFLPSLAAHLQGEAPHVRLDVTALGPAPDHDLDPTRTDRLDFLIAPFASKGHLKAPPHFKMRKLFSERIVVLARKDHPQIKSRLSMTAFTQAAHILIAPRGGWLTGSVDRAMGALGLKRNIRITVPHYMVAPHVVAQTDMLVTLPERLAHHAIGTLPIRIHALPIAIPEFTISMAWHERIHTDLPHQWLRNRIAESCHSL
jgi:DNA-binding transcriptional LysR family regulator